MGRAVAGLFTRHGHSVVLGSRSQSERIETPGGPLEARSYRDAVAGADIVFLTTLWEHTESALPLASLRGSSRHQGEPHAH
jgi:predicted dinucleotide-binding enzyme